MHVVLKGGVSAAALEEYGPGLITHCTAKWLTENGIPAEFIAQMPSDPHDLPDGGRLGLINFFSILSSSNSCHG